MVTLITIALAGVLVSIGMGGYARVQKWCFYGGLVGVLVLVILLLVSSHASLHLLVQPRDAQAVRPQQRLPAVNASAAKAGYVAPTFFGGTFGQSCCWCRS